MARVRRPMSPHLEIYRWYPTMMMSIAHRVTGGAMATGLILLTWWLVALATGPGAFAFIHGIVDSWFGGLLLFLTTLTLFYHMGNGIRHLTWDMGYGFELNRAYASGYAVLAFAVVMTAVVWLVIAVV